ncbi:MAG TPA: ABC transporter permease [Pseudonocardiaceae bacterium]|jgi:NitT/TauT family transport system permease protein|nr:ABC transporter permease [Pseudonocardiaceae bacterium]
MTTSTTPVPSSAPTSDDPAPALPRAGRVTVVARRLRSPVLSVGFVVVVLAAWQLASSLRWVNPLYSSSPRQVIVSAWTFLPSAEGLNDMKISGEEFAIGLACAIVVGVVIGLLMGWYVLIEETLGLALNVFYSLPLVALAPIIVLWFGIGITSKIVVVFVAALFPILISTLTGVKNVDRTLINLARSYNASRTEIWRTILLPAAVPSIITGIRLGMATGLIGVIVGEFISSEAGVGFLISQAANNFNTDLLFVGLLVLAVVSVILTFVLRAIERRFSRWKVS